MSLAVIGTAALWLTFVWLGSAIVASILSSAKGYPEIWGLVTGALLSLVGAFIWAVWPPREISRWKLHEGLSSTARTALIVTELVLVAVLVYAVTKVDASGTGQIGLIVAGIMVLIVAATLVYAIDIKRAAGGKTMAELRTERQVLDSPSQPS